MDVNGRTRAALERLARRYASERKAPRFHEVERALRRAVKLAARAGFWPWSGETNILASSEVEHWITNHLGWSLPCAEALWLIMKCRGSPTSRVIDAGAGSGLWTRALQREFEAENVIGLDPEPRTEEIIKSTFEAWLEETDGLRHGDIVLLSWPPCTGQRGQDLGTNVLNAIGPEQTLVFVGAGPRGAAGTRQFHEQLSREFEEYATEPVPKIVGTIFPRDYARAYRRIASRQ